MKVNLTLLAVPFEREKRCTVQFSQDAFVAHGLLKVVIFFFLFSSPRSRKDLTRFYFANIWASNKRYSQFAKMLCFVEVSLCVSIVERCSFDWWTHLFNCKITVSNTCEIMSSDRLHIADAEDRVSCTSVQNVQTLVFIFHCFPMIRFW